MPHTIIDLKEPVSIPPDHLVWGFVTSPDDLRLHSISLADSRRPSPRMNTIGTMEFCRLRRQVRRGVSASGSTISWKPTAPISTAGRTRATPRKGQNIAYNIIQPYPMGAQKGIYPTIDIQP
ncbi:MAG: hypothetical protein MZV70_16140 [Desulfobacterales bacterium]|nr:hypothetical protein [Desulfobacterales bacterium]